MPTLPIFDEKAIWLVPAAFYLYDNFCTVDDLHIIILENHRRGWTFKLSRIPFIFAGKHLYFLPPLLPFLFAFKLPWLVTGQTNYLYEAARYRRRILVWRSKLSDFRIIAVSSWVNLFVLGPLLTIGGGFLFAIRFVLPIHVGLLVACLFLILINSRLLRFDRRTIVSCAAELILSPGYLPNICRRLSLSHVPEDVDGVFFLKRYGQPSTVESIVDVIQFRLSEMKSEFGESGDFTEDIEKYSAELRL
jgi:hypothetical protein